MLKRPLLPSLLCSLVTAVLAADAAAGVVLLNERDDGSLVLPDRGDGVLVDLPSCPSTGYDWHLVLLDRSVVKPQGSLHHGASGIPGAPERVTFRFRVVGSGSTRMVLKHYRSWQGPAFATDTFTLRFRVSRAGQIVLSERDDGAHLVMTAGTVLKVDLATNPSTGYDWFVTRVDPRVLTAGTPSYHGFSGPPGSPGRIVTPFRPCGQGTTGVTLLCFRPWIGPSSAVDSFSVVVRVV